LLSSPQPRNLIPSHEHLNTSHSQFRAPVPNRASRVPVSALHLGGRRAHGPLSVLENSKTMKTISQHQII
jgi:hypothetical protein